MYALVNDVELYPQFMPWCVSASILYQDEDEIRATIKLAKRGLQASFTTSNRLQKNKMIEMSLVEGPFHHLHGFWRFEPLQGNERACKVRLDMDFELANRVLALTLGPVFNKITNTLVDTFVKRADQCYGGR